MANTSGNGSWDKIQGGVKDTERLIGQRDYNSAMMKARQTLEFMVKQLAARAAIAEDGDLKDQIDILFENQWISKATCEHYHKIRMIGNKAAHEGDTSAYNANQAYHMLSQEVYTFANNYSNAQKGSRVKPQARSGVSAGKGAPADRSGGQTRRTPSQTSRSSASGRAPQTRRTAVSSDRSRRRHPQKRRGFTAYDLMKLLIPVLCIILLFLVVKLFGPGKDNPTPAKEQVTTEAPSQTAGTEAPTTEAASAVTYKTNSTLNVRSGPNTDSERIGQLPEGTAVEYVRAHDDDWAVILYEGQEAYVASQYLSTEE